MRAKKNIKPAGVHAMQVRRLCLFAVCLIAGFGLLAYRLVDLQILQHDRLKEEAKNNTERTIVRDPKRGDIRDSRGNLLATSKIVQNICADPDVLGTNYLTFARQI